MKKTIAYNKQLKIFEARETLSMQGKPYIIGSTLLTLNDILLMGDEDFLEMALSSCDWLPAFQDGKQLSVKERVSLFQLLEEEE